MSNFNAHFLKKNHSIPEGASLSLSDEAPFCRSREVLSTALCMAKNEKIIRYGQGERDTRRPGGGEKIVSVSQHHLDARQIAGGGEESVEGLF